MKVKIAIIALLAFAGLFLVNRSMNAKKEYIPGVPASDKPTARWDCKRRRSAR